MSLSDRFSIPVSERIRVGSFQLDDIVKLVQYLNVRDVHDYTCHIPFPYTGEHATKFVNSTLEKEEESYLQEWQVP